MTEFSDVVVDFWKFNQLDYHTHKRLAYEFFDEYGIYEKKFFPSLPYGNPQIGFTQAFKNKQVFVSGVGETDKGNLRFSYCFDSTGTVQWLFNDSIFVLIILKKPTPIILPNCTLRPTKVNWLGDII